MGELASVKTVPINGLSSGRLAGRRDIWRR